MFQYTANTLDVTHSLMPQTVSENGAVNGTAVDVSAYDGPILVSVAAAAASSGDTITFTVEHSEAASSGFSAVPAAALVSPDTADTETFSVVDATGAVTETLALKREHLRRYVRIVATVAGNGTPTATFTGALVAFNKYI